MEVRRKAGKVDFFILFFLAAGAVFPQSMGEGVQEEPVYRGPIPEELLRPRRDEAARYPADTVIGPLGQGRVSREAYETAKRAAEALLAGSLNAPVLSAVNRVFLENCMSALNSINPRNVRLGGGREEPDGSVSFMVRFAGREEGITGELFIRLEERRSTAAPQTSEAVSELAEEGDMQETDETGAQAEMGGNGEQQVQVMPAASRVERIWVFEDLVLEEARSREDENRDSRHRYDFPPYERFF